MADHRVSWSTSANHQVCASSSDLTGAVAQNDLLQSDVTAMASGKLASIALLAIEAVKRFDAIADRVIGFRPRLPYNGSWLGSLSASATRFLYRKSATVNRFDPV